MKTRGAGQVASSRPKPRQAVKRSEAKKRFRLDSDEEEDGEVEVKTTVVRTPRKRIRATGMCVSPVRGPGLPAIVVQAPTPIKRTLYEDEATEGETVEVR